MTGILHQTYVGNPGNAGLTLRADGLLCPFDEYAIASVEAALPA
ncbi:hypothetical protein ACFZAM_12485 [Streptomyces sp. NPDC008079]